MFVSKDDLFLIRNYFSDENDKNEKYHSGGYALDKTVLQRARIPTHVRDVIFHVANTSTHDSNDLWSAYPICI